MARKERWPPRPHPHHASGQDRLRWRGKDYYLGPIGSQESRQAYARLLAQLAQDRPPAPAPAEKGLSVLEAVALWRVQALKRYGADNPERANFDYALEVLLAVHAGLPAMDFDADRLEEVREAMADKSWCRNHINRQITRIGTVWRWLERKKHVAQGAWAHLRTLEPLKPRNPGVRDSAPVRPADWLTLARVCRQASKKLRALLLVQWYTGMRPSDLRRMRAGEIDRQGEVWVYRPPLHKSAWRGHERLVYLGPKAQRVLAPWLDGKAPGDLVFPGRSGQEYTRQGLGLVISKAAKKAGVQFYAYQSRHAAKERLTRELGLEAARAVLGHRSLETTNGYASGIDTRLAGDAAKKCG